MKMIPKLTNNFWSISSGGRGKGAGCICLQLRSCFWTSLLRKTVYQIWSATVIILVQDMISSSLCYSEGTTIILPMMKEMTSAALRIFSADYTIILRFYWESLSLKIVYMVLVNICESSKVSKIFLTMNMINFWEHYLQLLFLSSSNLYIALFFLVQVRICQTFSLCIYYLLPLLFKTCNMFF